MYTENRDCTEEIKVSDSGSNRFSPAHRDSLAPKIKVDVDT